MSKKVYFVRHGQSIGNVDGTYHGGEVKLTSYGQKQADLVARRCADLDFELIVSSTMERARATAGAIHELTQKPIIYSDTLVERIEPSFLRGQHSSDPAAKRGGFEWTETFFKKGARLADGENYDDILGRVKQSLKLLEERPEENIVAVTHGFFLRMMVAYLTLGEELTPDLFKAFLAAFRTSNTGITYITSVSQDIWYPWMGDRKWVIRSWNDYAHLGEYHSAE